VGNVYEIEVSGRNLSIESGRWARQAGGAAVVRYGESVVLVTACLSENPRPGIDFLPLVVDYVEKTSAVGKIPGGFFKREGRLSEFEILTSRMIDRPIRPLFPKGFYNEIQIVATVLSADKENDTGILAMVGASAALSISEIPFAGPIAGLYGEPSAEPLLVAPPTLLPRGIEEMGCEATTAIEAIADVDVVYVLRMQSERMQPGAAFIPSLREYTALYGVTPERVRPGQVVMHPGPMNRGIEIDPRVADSGASLVTTQVRSGLIVRMAVLYDLLTAPGLHVAAPALEVA